MQKTQNITIVMLLMTAAILTSLLAAGWLYTEQPAYAGGVSRAGDYIMASGQYDADTDFIYVLDMANAKLNVYYPDINTNQLKIGVTVDVGAAFRAGPR
jgi:hypothetical protein